MIITGTLVSSCSNESSSANLSNKELIIAIQPFENFPTEEVNLLQQTIHNFYGCQIKLLDPIELPNKAFINVKSPRYRADSLIKYLKSEVEGNFDYIIGLTSKDISTTKYSNRSTKTIKEPEYKYQDWGIFGLGYMPGKSCIVSTFRIKKNVSTEKFQERFMKICCHELGHNFGLSHCPNKSCIMQDAAETIKTIDGVQLELCDQCKKAIHLSD